MFKLRDIVMSINSSSTDMYYRLGLTAFALGGFLYVYTREKTEDKVTAVAKTAGVGALAGGVVKLATAGTLDGVVVGVIAGGASAGIGGIVGACFGGKGGGTATPQAPN
jgi:hypothetical protein